MNKFNSKNFSFCLFVFLFFVQISLPHVPQLALNGGGGGGGGGGVELE